MTAQARQLKQQLRSALVAVHWAMARAGHLLNASIVLATVHGLSGLFRAVLAVEPKLQALVYDILPWRKVPESDARSVECGFYFQVSRVGQGGLSEEDFTSKSVA